MSMLRGELWVMIPGTGLRSLEDLKETPALLSGMEPGRRADPNGALGITDEIEYVMVEDALNGAAGFFLDDLPDLLRAGQGGEYGFRSGPERVAVEVDGDEATLTGWDGSELSTPVADLLRVLEQMQAEYAELSALLSGG
ncbi:hypothetical protein [Microbulbifer sp. S227A]|uniref:hypothetical protein n=1 Tax=Microbulbifer sp. S227A TaxID=3415131 RepID=UPI003C7CCA8C